MTSTKRVALGAQNLMGSMMGSSKKTTKNIYETKQCGGPGAIRTPDPQIRSLMLYPAELWNQLGAGNSRLRPPLQARMRETCKLVRRGFAAA